MDLLALHNPAEVVAAKTAGIYDRLRSESPRVAQANFTVLGTEDLQRLFQLYDEQFFAGWLATAVVATAGRPPAFRLSSTMTRAGGKTIKHRRRGPDGNWREWYEIAVGTSLLFMTFGDIQRPVAVSGLTCRDRLEALQRIMEHEIIHLAELLAWGKSSCSAARFRMLARNIFGHRDIKHALVTPGERAQVQFGIWVGSHVEFGFDGARLVGRVNRIGQRATVLVEAADGQQYTDGGKYRKYYVPLPLLKLVN